MSQVGKVAVDSGMIWIGDPCYVIHTEPEESYKGLGKDWHEFCKLMGSKSHKQFAFKQGNSGLGICVGGFGGDGKFPVFVEKDKNGLVKSVTIQFHRD